MIFDCDGVLIDSEPIAVAILRQYLSDLGVPMPGDEVHHRFTGWTTTQIAEAIAVEFGVQVPADWAP